MSEPTVIRPSSLPAWNDCARRVAANELLREEVQAKGVKLYPRKVDVGAAIGHSLHAGGAYLLIAKRDGKSVTLDQAVECGVAACRQEIKDGCNYDKKPGVTSAQEAEKHIGRMLFVYHAQVLPLIDPDYIEEELRADVGDGFILVGHPDDDRSQPTTPRSQVRRRYLARGRAAWRVYPAGEGERIRDRQGRHRLHPARLHRQAAAAGGADRIRRDPVPARSRAHHQPHQGGCHRVPTDIRHRGDPRESDVAALQQSLVHRARHGVLP